jgi:hypothetical protein
MAATKRVIMLSSHLLALSLCLAALLPVACVTELEEPEEAEEATSEVDSAIEVCGDIVTEEPFLFACPGGGFVDAVRICTQERKIDFLSPPTPDGATFQCVNDGLRTCKVVKPPCL